MGRQRGDTGKLAPGKTSIDRANPRQRPDGEWWLDWTVCLHDGRTLRRRSKGPTKGVARRRAETTAAELLKTGANGHWKTTDPLPKYVDQVTKPALAKASIKPLTRTRYDLALKWLLGDCGQHRHTHSLKGHSIASGTKFSALEKTLTEIATLHGSETAHQARTVISKYVILPLVRDELIAGNPLAGVSLETVTGKKRPPRTRGGKALTREQHEAVISYLLELDPAEATDSLGRALRPTSVATRRNAIDLTLLQAVTGLRGREANGVDWSLVSVVDDDDEDDGGQMAIEVTEEIAKGSVPRVVLVLDERVAERLLERRDAAGGKGYVIGSPADPERYWDVRNKDKATRALYLQIADELGIDIMEVERSHMWRTTLRNIYDGRIPAAVLNSQFGHSEKTAQRHYTDPGDLSRLAQEARSEARRRTG